MKNKLNLSLLLLIIAAQAFYTKPIIGQSTDSASFFINRGDSFFRAKIYSQSLKAYEASERYQKPSAETSYKMAVVADSAKMISLMHRYYEQAYTLEPNNPKYQNSVGNMYFNFKMWKKAIDLYQNCLSCENRNMNLGRAYFETENYSKALEILKPLADNGNGEAAFYLAKTYSENDDEKNAGIYYIKALDSKDVKPSWLYEGAIAAYNATDYKRAADYFERCNSKGFKLNKDIQMLYAFSLMATNRMQEGENLLRPIIEQTINKGKIYKEIGTHLYSLKNFDRAISYFEMAFKLDNKDAMALYQAGLCFIGKGGKFKKQGENMCDKAILINPKLSSLRTKTGSMGGQNFGL